MVSIVSNLKADMKCLLNVLQVISTLPTEFSRTQFNKATNKNIYFTLEWLVKNGIVVETREEPITKMIKTEYVRFPDECRMTKKKWYSYDPLVRVQLYKAHGDEEGCPFSKLEEECLDVEISTCRKWYTFNKEAIAEMMIETKLYWDRIMAETCLTISQIGRG